MESDPSHPNQPTSCGPSTRNARHPLRLGPTPLLRFLSPQTNPYSLKKKNPTNPKPVRRFTTVVAGGDPHVRRGPCPPAPPRYATPPTTTHTPPPPPSRRLASPPFLHSTRTRAARRRPILTARLLRLAWRLLDALVLLLPSLSLMPPFAIWCGFLHVVLPGRTV
nr:unnamed protein product [Digitaria exilis]